MQDADVLIVGKTMVSRRVYFVDELGKPVRPIFQKNRDTGVRSFRVYPDRGNTKAGHIEVYTTEDLARYAADGHVIRCLLPNGQANNVFISSAEVNGRLVVERDNPGSNFWWVNHKQTWRAEYEHGYIWSPTANKNGATNQTYLNLKFVRPGDLVFSYAGAVVRGVGIATGPFTDAEIPNEHWQAEEGWLKAGWSVPIRWFTLAEPWSPKAHFSAIRHLLPAKHSPLQHETGNGNQGCYLASVSSQFGAKVLELLQAENATVVDEVLTEATTTRAVESASSPSDASMPTAGRLPAEQLRKITSDFIWKAVQELLRGATVEGFKESIDYDLVADGVRLAPKRVLGLAGTAALGFQLKPSHFTAGKGSLCFELLQAAGFQIVPKGEELPALELPIEPEERKWVEGHVKLVYHLDKERSAGLSQAKKEDFRKKHNGRLFCEECLLDPVQKWGPAGEACIEVHHDEVHVADMKPGHLSSLEELKCLCANCHRVLHRKLRDQLAKTHSA